MNDLDQYVKAIMAGDTSAFAAWVSRAEPRIRASLAGFATCVDTEAVMQECLLRIWQVAPKFEEDGRPDGLLRLAVSIAYNLAITESRRRRTVNVDPEKLAETTATKGATADPVLRETIMECLKRLPRTPRRVLDMRLNSENMSDAAQAAAINMKVNTFFQNIRRARQHLAECLRRHGVLIYVDK